MSVTFKFLVSSADDTTGNEACILLNSLVPGKAFSRYVVYVKS